MHFTVCLFFTQWLVPSACPPSLHPQTFSVFFLCSFYLATLYSTLFSPYNHSPSSSSSALPLKLFNLSCPSDVLISNLVDSGHTQ